MYRVAVDIGGTFTDCVIVDEQGSRSTSKSLTTHDALSNGVLAAVETNAEQLGLSLEELLRETTLFVHGTTVGTNALLTRTGAQTGLITTRGHEDALIIGKVFAKRAGLSEREIVHASRLNKPRPPLVPPQRIVGVSERIDVEGEVIVELNEDDVVEAIKTLVADGVEAIAVSFLWSFINPVHEKRVGELLAEHAPNVFVTLSSDIAPVLGEYERTSTAVLNAYVGPKVAGYLDDLAARLKERGLTRPLLVMQSSGGLTSVDDARTSAIVTLDSGPTGGILGSQYLSRLYGEPNVICTDVGGTSFETGLILRGEVPLEPEPIVAQYSFRIPKIGVRSIGAGGGSIAWLDEGGLLRVGPQSAGSQPGPACYGRGGTQPTVTDADLVLGYLDPDYFLGGRMPLDLGKAREALSTIGDEMGAEPEEVAMGIFRIINSHMADLIRRSTIEQGHDPRDSVLVAYGGAGPTHAVFYGHDIGAKATLVLADSSVFSAFGMLTCDMTHTAQVSQPISAPFSESDLVAIESHYSELEQRVLEQFEGESIDTGEVTLGRTVTVRYKNQVHSLEVDVTGELSSETVSTIEASFAERYKGTYGEASLLAGGALEFESYRVTGTYTVEPAQFMPLDGSDEDASAAQRGERDMIFDDGGLTSSAIFDGSKLVTGNRVEGPAVIERMGDSVVVPPGYQAVVDPYLTLVLSQTSAAPLAVAAGSDRKEQS
jgi:N-methylhydantoinase A